MALLIKCLQELRARQAHEPGGLAVAFMDAEGGHAAWGMPRQRTWRGARP